MRAAEFRRHRAARSVTRREAPEVIRLGVAGPNWRDAYHLLLTTTWPRLLLVFLGMYLGVNSCFALAYLATGNSIENAHSGSFPDAFFFSVQTLATIGYGYMYPKGLATNVLVALESLCGVVVFALFTGLAFARFSRPTARVAFSDLAVVTAFDGVPTLMLRAANQRRNQILEAQARLTFLRDERSREGIAMRRLHDLKLIRDATPVFAYTWMIMHRIDESSPLFGLSPADLQELGGIIIVSVAGLDDALSQAVHARKLYEADQLRFGQRFVDITSRDAEGRRYSDYRRLSEVETS